MVDGGIDVFKVDSLSDGPIQFTAIAKLAFSEPDTDKTYTASFKVFAPGNNLIKDAPGHFPTTRPEGANMMLPFTFCAVQAIAFLPPAFGLYTVRFDLDGVLRKDLPLVVQRRN